MRWIIGECAAIGVEIHRRGTHCIKILEGGGAVCGRRGIRASKYCINNVKTTLERLSMKVILQGLSVYARACVCVCVKAIYLCTYVCVCVRVCESNIFTYICVCVCVCVCATRESERDRENLNEVIRK